MSTPTKHQEVESKVKKYIQSVKKSDDESRKSLVKPEVTITLEELYDVDTKGDHLSPEGANLSRTLRVLKEKDMMILKLRQTCTDLAIKCANAENKIDDLRYGKRGEAIKSRKDVSVETESRVLEQQCVDWLEKVQNWRADAIFNSSHEESCGDSGFRGSELDLKNTIPNINNTTVCDVGVSTTTMTTTAAAIAQLAQNTSTTPSKDVYNLNPLLDEATSLAKRVKEKSVRLAAMLKE